MFLILDLQDYKRGSDSTYPRSRLLACFLLPLMSPSAFGMIVSLDKTKKNAVLVTQTIFILTYGIQGMTRAA